MAGSGNAQLRNDRADVLLRVECLVRTYLAKGGQRVQALSDLSFDVVRGETLGIVGESGCGKSSLAKSLMMLPPPTSGSIRFEQASLTGIDSDSLRMLRRRMQMVFQDPVSSLNPRHTVSEIVEAPLTVNRIGCASERKRMVSQTLEAVGLAVQAVGSKRPHELSGGQCQRVSLARALVLRPALLICDEPVSALDVSVQAQVINLLESAKAEFALTMLFISHDLAVIKAISDRVMVMYLGKICEIGPVEQVFRRPRHPYTAGLLAAKPVADPAKPRAERRVPIGETPSPMAMPSGCRFHTRCPRASATCRHAEPVIRSLGHAHFFACHHPLDADEVNHRAETVCAVASDPAT
jgi:peptide/nickel transport system ATP-binding protein